MHYGWQSASVWVILMLLSFMGGNAAFAAGLRTMQLLFGLAYVGATARSLRHDLSLAQTFHRLLYAWLLFGTLAFGYWCVFWLVALIPLIPSREVRLPTITFAWCGPMSVAIYTFVGRWVAGGPSLAGSYSFSIGFVFGLPILVSLWLHRCSARRLNPPTAI